MSAQTFRSSNQCAQKMHGEGTQSTQVSYLRGESVPCVHFWSNNNKIDLCWGSRWHRRFKQEAGKLNLHFGLIDGITKWVKAV